MHKPRQLHASRETSASFGTYHFHFNCSKFVCWPGGGRNCPGVRNCISAAPAALDRYPRGLTGHVAHPIRSIDKDYRFETGKGKASIAQGISK